MKKILWAGLSALALSACAPTGLSLGLGTGFGGHLGAGIGLNFPLNLTPRSQPSVNDNGVNIIREEVLTYFDEAGRPTRDYPKNKGVMRRIMAHQGRDELLVQDFYLPKEIKRTDPMLLPRARAHELEAHPDNGSVTVYARDGKIIRSQLWRQNELISDRVWPAQP